ncbi:chitin disaccharide deacetylase [Halalkalibacterium halodurans]|uniref:Carbohydrate deacetylase n=1 Tax=Halalkalibacterium halodurans TaxID=86665 RepID=A0A0M0KC14_ALKHA|nr:chitin disaccharide deacetylase [Halalkalibacterium halodurans]MED3648218.1 chitin disaccharide deacetylase [Halalkalibacterium halodurans]TES52521.1 chitin disaccharide deacetylase [Halalkalibacterium halodurans]TPE70362.1 chitin disaccharide deacetylase [Halalkalibacterium halodurans]
MKLIVNADDFGLSRGVNYGIVDAHELGIVTSTTMLTNMPATNHAFQLMEKYPKLKVGVHLTLSCGAPITTDCPTLINPQGEFRLTSQYPLLKEHGLSEEEVEAEWEAQIQQFYKRGMTPSHLDSHHHIHTWEPIIPVIKRLAQKYDLPVRTGFRNPPNGVRLWSDVIDAGFYGEGVKEKYFIELYEKFKAYDGTIEIMCHPAYIDEVLRQHSSYVEGRLKEFEILTRIKLAEDVTLI